MNVGRQHALVPEFVRKISYNGRVNVCVSFTIPATTNTLGIFFVLFYLPKVLHY